MKGYGDRRKQANAASNLMSMFDEDEAVTRDSNPGGGNSSLFYKPQVDPSQKKKAAQRKQANPAPPTVHNVLALKLNGIYKHNASSNEMVPQPFKGVLGVAIMGDGVRPGAYVFVIYDSAKNVLVTMPVSSVLRCSVMHENYVYFYDQSNVNWSFLVGTSAEASNFVRCLSLVKIHAAVHLEKYQQPFSVCITPGPDTNSILKKGDCVNIRYRAWKLVNDPNVNPISIESSSIPLYASVWPGVNGASIDSSYEIHLDDTFNDKCLFGLNNVLQGMRIGDNSFAVLPNTSNHKSKELNEGWILVEVFILGVSTSSPVVEEKKTPTNVDSSNKNTVSGSYQMNNLKENNAITDLKGSGLNIVSKKMNQTSENCEISISNNSPSRKELKEKMKRQALAAGTGGGTQFIINRKALGLESTNSDSDSSNNSTNIGHTHHLLEEEIPTSSSSSSSSSSNANFQSYNTQISVPQCKGDEFNINSKVGDSTLEQQQQQQQKQKQIWDSMGINSGMLGIQLQQILMTCRGVESRLSDVAHDVNYIKRENVNNTNCGSQVMRTVGYGTSRVTGESMIESISAMVEANESLVQEKKELEAIVVTKDASLSNMQTMVNEMRSKESSILQDSLDIQKKLLEMQASISPLQTKLDEHKAKNEKSQVERSKILAENESLKTKYTTVNSTLNEMRISIQSAKVKGEADFDEKKALKLEIEELEKKLKVSKLELKESQDLMENTNQSLSEKVKQLSEELNLVKSTSSLVKSKINNDDVTSDESNEIYKLKQELKKCQSERSVYLQSHVKTILNDEFSNSIKHALGGLYVTLQAKLDGKGDVPAVAVLKLLKRNIKDVAKKIDKNSDALVKSYFDNITTKKVDIKKNTSSQHSVKEKNLEANDIKTEDSCSDQKQGDDAAGPIDTVRPPAPPPTTRENKSENL